MNLIKALLIIGQLKLIRGQHTAELFSFILLIIGLCLYPFIPVRASGILMRSHRNTRSLSRELFIEKIISKINISDYEISEQLTNTVSNINEPFPLSWIIKLKEKNQEEKGVLLVKYNETFSKLKKQYDIKKILDNYFLVLEPSVSGYCDPDILQYKRYKDSKIIIQASENKDYSFLKRFGNNLIPVEFGASDWVDDRIFYDLQLKKEYDCIMVAQWNPVKRHHVLFRAISQIKEKLFKAVIIGNSWGLTRKEIELMIDYYQISKNVEIIENITPEEVNQYLNKSKFNILLSLREGSNKAIFEGFFANIPGIVLENNIGVNKKYINNQTGRLVNEKYLSIEILKMRDNYKNYQPQNWARENISCLKTTEKLEKTLIQIASKQGLPWKTSLAVKKNYGPNPTYYDKDTSLTPFEFEQYKL